MKQKHERADGHFIPDPEQIALMPNVSGNAVNGVGETRRRRPTPIYHHDPERTPFAALQTWFRARPSHPSIEAARRKRISIMEEPIAPLAGARRQKHGAAISRRKAVSLARSSWELRASSRSGCSRATRCPTPG